ncbi:Uncharacterized protein TCM_000653 [Theobroma cacao]|uniref:Uncharacterized protein n=1 Tax=Theobroma cacao TaxID=3641 RepID=A0A061DGK0_THECC|nr:Uncharacterized protein TCM_000653 [Theobroma cacao]
MLVRVIEFDYNQRSLEILLLTENQIGCTESELDSGQERPGMPQVVVQQQRQLPPTIRIARNSRLFCC